MSEQQPYPFVPGQHGIPINTLTMDNEWHAYLGHYGKLIRYCIGKNDITLIDDELEWLMLNAFVEYIPTSKVGSLVQISICFNEEVR